MKVFFRRIHLYLSLAAGLVILIACLTGAILVFEKDLQMAINKDRYYVAQGGSRLPLQDLVKQVKTAYPDAKVGGIKVYSDPERSVEISANFPPKKKQGEAGQPIQRKPEPAAGGKEARSAERQPGYTLFVNPYTGKVLEKYSYRETGFYQVFALHRWLLGTDKGPGKIIVGVATFIFLFILITGIILWWPKTRRILKNRLRVKWDANWKRLNHDLHIVMGFYSAIFLFLFAFTGLAWSFEWFNKGIYTVTNSPLKNPPPPQSVYQADTKPISFDQAWAAGTTAVPQAVSYTISFPKDSTAAVTISVLPQKAIHEAATDAIYLDQYTGAVIGTLPYAERSLGARVRSTFKPVHTGSLWGMPSKIIAFMVCLLGVTFPVTGTIMWINRTRRKRKTSLITYEEAGALAD
ncbi:MAG TPA: PepSY-associated TM helix domain-containing protein [Flavisolibacter sp.]|jgi:uncharacterized iron-regulated membrane protein|nr:PepSY-associated TM helix domain-containing protein [Flavisolibacter sp.]